MTTAEAEAAAAAFAAVVHRLPKICWACFRQTPDMMRCGRCRTAHFCDAQCQKWAWPSHRRVCDNAGTGCPVALSRAVTLASRGKVQLGWCEVAHRELVVAQDVCQGETLLTLTGHVVREEVLFPRRGPPCVPFEASMDAPVACLRDCPHDYGLTATAHTSRTVRAVCANMLRLQVHDAGGALGAGKHAPCRGWDPWQPATGADDTGGPEVAWNGRFGLFTVLLSLVNHSCSANVVVEISPMMEGGDSDTAPARHRAAFAAVVTVMEASRSFREASGRFVSFAHAGVVQGLVRGTHQAVVVRVVATRDLQPGVALKLSYTGSPHRDTCGPALARHGLMCVCRPLFGPGSGPCPIPDDLRSLWRVMDLVQVLLPGSLNRATVEFLSQTQKEVYIHVLGRLLVDVVQRAGQRRYRGSRARVELAKFQAAVLVGLLGYERVLEALVAQGRLLARV
jgi:hypothetical protein